MIPAPTITLPDSELGKSAMTILPASPNRVLRPREAAAYLAVSRTTLYEMCQRRELPCIKIGTRSTRLLQSDLDAYIAAHRVMAVD